MANISIRKLDESVYKKLCIRAAQNGVSMEEEVRQIVTREVSSPNPIVEVFQKYFGKKNGIDLEIPNQCKPHHPIEFK